MPVVQFVLYWGTRAVDAVRNFESKLKLPLGIATLRNVSALADPAFGEELLVEMAKEKTNVAHFANVLGRCIRQQWAYWQVFHPELAVHPDRRVPLSFLDSIVQDNFGYNILDSAAALSDLM